MILRVSVVAVEIGTSPKFQGEKAAGMRGDQMHWPVMYEKVPATSSKSPGLAGSKAEMSVW